jgi:hypothetical protein
MMILLTSAEADEVRGDTEPGHALEPVKLKSGDFVLPPEVIDDPMHAEHHDFLNSLPLIADPDPEDYYNAGGATGATGAQSL